MLNFLILTVFSSFLLFRRSLVTVRLMIFQTAILQPIIQFISAVLWADDKYDRVGVRLSLSGWPTLSLVAISIYSILFLYLGFAVSSKSVDRQMRSQSTHSVQASVMFWSYFCHRIDKTSSKHILSTTGFNVYRCSKQLTCNMPLSTLKLWRFFFFFLLGKEYYGKWNMCPLWEFTLKKKKEGRRTTQALYSSMILHFMSNTEFSCLTQT